jgi:hypothetical protein
LLGSLGDFEKGGLGTAQEREFEEMDVEVLA